MKLDDLIQILRQMRNAHGNLDVFTRDVMSGVGGAVIPQRGVRIATLAALKGRERKRREYSPVGRDQAGHQPGEAVVLL